jgi:glycine/D-amino acid oxidase-like deaminating enzyme
MAIALAAADAGLHVTLVGRGSDEPGTASSAAGAMLGVLGEHTAAENGTHGRADLMFRHEASLLWPEWLAQISESGGASVTVHHGTVVIANLEHPRDHDNLDCIRRAAAILDLPADDLDPRHVPGLRPAPRHAPVAALSLPCEGWVDADVLLCALRDACRAHRRVQRVRQGARRIALGAGDSAACGVLLDDGSHLASNQVVLAAGAGSAELLAPIAPLLGALPAVRAAKGVSLVMDVLPAAQPPVVIRTPNRDFGCGLHLVPRGSGGLYVGATNRFTDSPATGLAAGEQMNLLHGLLHQLRVDLRRSTIMQMRWGNRPATTDGDPLIGPCELPGLLLATGTYRNGILLAPAVATIIRGVLTGTPAALPNPYTPAERRQRALPDLRQLTTDGAQDMTSALLDPDGMLPFDREAQLSATLAALLDLALGDDRTAIASRAKLREQLVAHPTIEGVCGIFDGWET